MSDRIPLADLTVDQYDAFCDEADRMALELATLRTVARGYCPHCGRGDAAPTVEDWEQQRQRADQAETERDQARATNQRLNCEKQRLESELAAYRRAVAQWEINDRGTYVPLRTIAAIAKAAGLNVDQRVEQAEAVLSAIDPVKLDLLADWFDSDDAAKGPGRDVEVQADLRRWARTIRALDQPTAGPAATQTTDVQENAVPAITTGLVVQPYRNDRGEPAWVFRCWGTDTCDGWLSLDHASEQSARRARDRHVAEEHAEPGPAATRATDNPA